MIQKYKELVDKLLKYDLEQFAVKLELDFNPQIKLSDSEICKLLNFAEYLSRRAVDDTTRNLCVTICGLIWEHKKPEWKGMIALLKIIFFRLGLTPSAIMIDSHFDNLNNSFSGLDSYINELKATSLIINNEVQIAAKKNIMLSHFQKRVWEAIDLYNRIGISAQTSAGKSFILIHKLIDILNSRSGNVFYIVPTITLINQVTSDFRCLLNELKLNNINVAQTYSINSLHENQSNIFVLTQERAISALEQSIESRPLIKILVIDEVQNLERVANEGNERAKDLTEVIQDIEYFIHPEKVIISGPRVKGMDQLVIKLFGENAVAITDELPAVLNVTYAFSLNKKKPIMKQYIGIRCNPQQITLNSFPVKSESFFNKAQYREPVLNMINYFISKLSKDEGCIIFAGNKAIANKIAISIRQNKISDNRLDELCTYLESTVHKKYSMINTIRNNTGYHHANVPFHVRLVLEKAFSMRVINNIVCTTSLLQGVNLPAKNLIVKDTKFSTKGTDRLTPYEFANLRGRAGRLMQDFVGRAIVLDELALNSSETNLFEYPEKEIVHGYGKRFMEYRDSISNALIDQTIPHKDNKSFNDLTTYIRQIVMKYGAESIWRLKNVGITLTNSEYINTHKSLSELTVPNEIVQQNRHWDPFVLEKVFAACKDFKLNFPSSFEIEQFKYILSTLVRIAPYYYDKYFGITDDRLITKCLLIAEGWSKERPLNEIINWKSDVDEKEVDNVLNLLNDKVMYDLGKLIRPIQTIKNANSPVLVFIEMGAYKPITRRLIEFGIPRELSIKLSKIAPNKWRNFDIDDFEIEKFLISLDKGNNLSFWENQIIKDFIFTN